MAGDNDQWAQRVLDAVHKIAYSPSNTWNQAGDYSSLPDPTTQSGATWLVLAGSGIWPLNHPSGWYYSNGIDWLYLGAYNPVVTGGNVTVTNFPSIPSTGEGLTVMVSQIASTRLLAADSLRKGFILTAEVGIIYIGIGFQPTDAQYTYRMTNHSVVEKDGFTGPVYAITEDNPKSVYVTEIK